MYPSLPLGPIVKLGNSAAQMEHIRASNQCAHTPLGTAQKLFGQAPASPCKGIQETWNVAPSPIGPHSELMGTL